MKQAIAITCLFLGVFIESALWDEQMMRSPDELTVTDFELAEEGLSVVLANAIEDARALVEYMDAGVEKGRAAWVQASSSGEKEMCKLLEPQIKEGDQMRFRAMRVLGLLEATREREAGQLV